MASFLCQVQTIQRSAGRSAVAAAAYRSGMALTDERLAMDFDFAGKEGVEFAEILAPETAPSRFSDCQTLWNAAENREARKDAVPARELLLALPHELDFEQRRALVRAFVAEHLVGQGMASAAGSASFPTRNMTPDFDAQHSMFPSSMSATPPNMRRAPRRSSGNRARRRSTANSTATDDSICDLSG